MKYTFDHLGPTLTSTDQRGVVHSYGYDALSRGGLTLNYDPADDNTFAGWDRLGQIIDQRWTNGVAKLRRALPDTDVEYSHD